MKFPSLMALVAAAVLVSACGTTAQRAVWTWETESYAMLEDTAVADEAVEFLRSKGIDTIYLYTDTFRDRSLIQSEPERYRQLIRRLHRDGLRAYALLGSAYLHTEEYVLPGRQREALAMLQRVLAYNASAGPDERFDGVNLDIEPHLLPQWRDDKLTVMRQYLDLGEALMALKRKSGQALAIGPAIPFWLDGIRLEWHGRNRLASEHVIQIYDYVAVMDYRNRAEGADGIISLAMDEMKYAAHRDRKVVIGVEVTPNEIDKVSFDGLTEADLERELGLARKAFGGDPAFAGFAIHDYRGYREWLDRQRPKP